MDSSSCLHDRATIRSGAEIGLLSLRLSVSQGAPLGDFLLAPACPIEKVTNSMGGLIQCADLQGSKGTCFALKQKSFLYKCIPYAWVYVSLTLIN